MNGKDFLNSKWCKEAASEEKQNSIKQNFGKWSTRVNNTGLLTRAKQLYQFFLSSEIKGTSKILVAGALLYIISPLDIIPDFIPVVGWLDDIGIASFALSYIFSQMDELEKKKLEAESGDVIDSNRTVDELLEAEIAGTQKSFFKDVAEDAGFCVDIPRKTTELEHTLAELTQISSKLKMENSIEYLDHISNRMAAVELQKCIVVGRYSTGKSTLINALLDIDVLPSSPVPTTKAVTYIMQGNEALLYSESPDGEVVIHDSLKDLKNLYDKDINRASKITVTLPEVTFSGLTIVDTPGLEEPDQATSQLTLDIVPEADAIIVVLDAGYMESKVEFDFISSLAARDKDRKLFVVINKADTITETEISQIESLCKTQLYAYGINSAQVFTISAKQGSKSNKFVEFKQELFKFLAEDIKSEAYRHTDAELKNYAGSLLEACNIAIDNAGESERIQRQRNQEHLSDIEEICKQYERQEKDVISKFNQYKAQFVLDFSNFISLLKSEVNSQIQHASLETLQNTDNIANHVKSQISNFIDEKISDIEKNVQADIKKSQASLRTHLAGMRISISVNGKDYSNSAGLFLPIAVVSGYLFCGFFSAIGILIVGLIGRNFFETAIAKYLRSLSVNHLRGKLAVDVSSNIDNLHKKLEVKLNEVFEDIEKNIIETLKNDRNQIVAPLNIIANNAECTVEAIDQCRQSLCKIIDK